MRPSHAVVEKPAADFFKQVTGPWCFFQAVLPADAPAADPVLSLACHMAIFAATPLAAFVSASFFSSKNLLKAHSLCLENKAGFASWPAPIN